MICDICELRCDLNQMSLCGAYQETDNRIEERMPFLWSTCRTTLSENIPLYHFWPRRKLLELGGTCCNANCDYCISARIMVNQRRSDSLIKITPERAIFIAQKKSCMGVNFAINEITANLLSALEIAHAAKRAGMIVGALTNGYMTLSTAEQIVKDFDYLNISLKSLSNTFYQHRIGLPEVGTVMRNIDFFVSKLHLEITTPIVQGENDHEILPMAKFLAGIDREIPWHIYRLIPLHKMNNSPQSDVDEITEQVLQVRKILPFTYFSNFIGSQLDNTVCPTCGTLLIRRLCVKSCGASLMEYNLSNDKQCPVCKSNIKLCGEPASEIRTTL